MADYKTQVLSLRQEKDSAKLECQKVRHGNEILEKDVCAIP